MVNILKDEEFTTMKKLHITKEHFEKSKYFTKKYGTLKFVSESGRLFKTDKGHVLRFDEGMRREVMPMNGRKSFGHKAVEEEDENGFTLYSYETPIARLERRDDGSGLDFCLLDDYLSATTLTHIHSWLIRHHQKDIPTKKLLELPVGQEVPMMAAESKKLVKEGAGAGYTVTIKNVKLANAKVINRSEDGDWEFEADIVKDTYKVEAEDYYNRFCPISQYDEEWVEVAGKVYGVCWWYEEERDVERQVNGQEQDIGFDYGGGWTHVDLPKDGHITADRIRSDEHDTWAIQSIELFAPQVSDAVNYCHEHFLDEEEGSEEEVDESKQVVKENASELSKFAEELDGLFGKKVLARVNSTGTECTVDTPPALDKEVQHFIQSACDANGWECKRIVRNLILTYRIKCGEETVQESDGDNPTLDDIYQAEKGKYTIKVNGKVMDAYNSIQDARKAACEMVAGSSDTIEIADPKGRVVYTYWENPETLNDYEKDAYGKVRCVDLALPDHDLNRFHESGTNEEPEPTLDDIYKAVKEEYGGKLFSDNFLKLNVEHVSGQVLCIFELDKPEDMGANDGDDEWWEDKKDSAIMFYDELVKFLVDKFGEKFRFTDPRVSDEYADKSDPKANFEILIDDDDASLPIIAIDEVADGWYDK